MKKDFTWDNDVDLIGVHPILTGGYARSGTYTVKQIETLSGGTLRLVPGNFYSVLSRLMEEGLLEESERRASEDLDNRKRRYYVITTLGREVASAETSRLKALVKVAEEHDLARGAGRAR